MNRIYTGCSLCNGFGCISCTKNSVPPQAQPAESVDAAFPALANAEILHAMLSWRECDSREGLTGELDMMDRIYYVLRSHLVQRAESAKQSAPVVKPTCSPLSDTQLEKIWKDTFSTNNPFCPCNLKTFLKVARAVEQSSYKEEDISWKNSTGMISDADLPDWCLTKKGKKGKK